MVKAVITGISGQDGSYLAQKLVTIGYNVIGVIRPNQDIKKLNGLNYLGVLQNIKLLECRLDDSQQVSNLIAKVKPDIIYNLAAQSSVGESFSTPHESILFNVHSTLNILESIRLTSPETKLYQATSSEMYGSVAYLPITKNTMLHPQSPYTVSKAACHHLVRNYREPYDLFACSGILFNHESVLRRDNFFIMKVIKTALDIKHGRANELRVGNIDIKRDFGYAPHYVDDMVKMMHQTTPSDYIICSGVSVTLRSIIEHVFDCLGIQHDRIIVDSKFFRPSDIDDIYDSNDRAHSELKWEYDTPFFKVMEGILYEYESNFYEA